MWATPCAARSAWRRTATSPRSPATCRSPTGSLACCRHSFHAPSLTWSCAICPAWARAPRSASTARASPPWSSCSPSTARHARALGFRVGRPSVPLAARRRDRRRRRARPVGHTEVPRPLPRPRPRVPVRRRRLGCRAQAAAQGRHAPPHGALLHRRHVGHGQVRAHPRAGAGASHKAKQHTSGIQHTAWGMEARFRDCQDTLSLLDILRKTWASAREASSTNAPSSSASPCASCSPKANTSPTCSASPATAPSLSATMDKLNLKYGHTTLHFAGMLPARETAPTRIAFTQIPVLYGERIHVNCRDITKKPVLSCVVGHTFILSSKQRQNTGKVRGSAR